MKIITLTGSSASGKDFLLNEILKDNKGVKPVVSVTTRPKRDGEVDGVDYKFISIEEFLRLLSAKEMIEFREYNTVEGVWYYGVSKDSIDVNSDDTYVVILDFYGVIQLRNYLETMKSEDNNIDVHSIFVNCRGQERMLRSLHREANLNDYQVAELCRRYLDDLERVAAHRDSFDIILRNETPEDLEQNKFIIKTLIENKKSKSKIEVE